MPGACRPRKRMVFGALRNFVLEPAEILGEVLHPLNQVLGIGRERGAHDVLAELEHRHLVLPGVVLEADREEVLPLLREEQQRADYDIKVDVELAEMIAALLAILKADGAFVALDPSYPLERLSFALEDSGARVLLTESKLQGSLGAPKVVCLDTFWSAEAGEDSVTLVSRASPENLVYVAYTSGSTGKPKGVQIPHAGVASYLDFLTEKFHLGESDVVLQLTSLSFDASVREILGPLIAGSRLVLVSAADAKDPVALLSAIRREGVTCLLAVVPSLLRELTDTAQRRRLTLPSLRLLMTTGERLLFADCHAVFQVLHDGVSLVNQYGPAECSMIAAYFPVTQPAPADGAVPIGGPVDNCRLYILDRYLSPVPVGMPGELYIGGAGVGRGYVNNPELTQANFIPDPFSFVSGQRVYRTGDLARRRSDGWTDSGQAGGQNQPRYAVNAFAITPAPATRPIRNIQPISKPTKPPNASRA